MSQQVGANILTVRQGLDAYLEFHLVNGPLLGLLVEEAMRSGSPLHARRRWLRDELHQLLERAAG